MLEIVANDGLDQLGRLDADKFFLRLPLELRLLDEDGYQSGGALDHVLGGDDRALAITGEVGIALEAAQQRTAEARLVRATFGGRHGVAIGADEAFLVRRPPYGPFHLAAGGAIGLAPRLAGKWLRHDGRPRADLGRQVILQAAGETERLLGGDRAALGQQRRLAPPADLDAAEQIGLGPRHAIETLGDEELLAEDLLVRMERDGRAAASGGGARRLEL